MNPLLLPLALLLGLAIGAGAVAYVRRRAAAEGQRHQHDAVAAAVQATLAEREATAAAVERDREATVQAAVTRAAEIADQKLDARLRQGQEQLHASLQQGTTTFVEGTNTFEKEAAEMRAEMRRMQKAVHNLQEKSAGQYGKVETRLQEAMAVTGQLQATTGSLREALGSAKKRGNWGERMAEDVLTAAGMKRGVNYRAQQNVESGGRPDFTFLMPHGRVLHMDVKFPIDNYLRFLEATESGADDAERFRVQFVKDARDRVRDLAQRAYQDEADSVDTVVLFIPNESVFVFLQESAPELLDEAMRCKIVLCGPATLVAVLQIVRQAMANFLVEKRTAEIMECFEAFEGQWSQFSEKLTRHGKHLDTALRSYEELIGARTNQLQKQMRKIDRLKTAELEEIDDVAHDDDDDDDAVGRAEPAAGDSVPSEDEVQPAIEFPVLREVASA